MARKRRVEYYDPVKRAAEKQASRDRDAADLASGRKTREQLTRENGAFAFPDAAILWDKIESLL